MLDHHSHNPGFSRSESSIPLANYHKLPPNIDIVQTQLFRHRHHLKIPERFKLARFEPQEVIILELHRVVSFRFKKLIVDSVRTVPFKETPISRLR